MPLVFSAIVPHPPVLVPTIEKTDADPLEATRAAFQVLEHHLYAAKPDLLLIVTPHGAVLRDAWQLLIGDRLEGNLEEFSDFTTTVSVAGSIGFSHRLKERAEDHGFSVLLQSDRTLDYASVIPLLNLLNHLPKIRVAPLIVSGEDVPTQYEFGKLTREEVFATNDRVAVLASANLSHRLSRISPSGYRRLGKVFDDRIRKALERSDTETVVGTPADLADEAVTCGLRPIALLLGLQHRRPYTLQSLAYEHPHGVGYFTALLLPS